ncbi:hypothetical protein [Paenibacillus pini]|uniref:YmcC protein n=1 Tax=Paenibacillus pini JCM 16418 TaxID=1236976 RepID=W7YTU4_9BACL|nr:hypothetical protein [Paenibacillus pini]GAF10598.1 YmcC protein [Paenibacillus pini JCM 16418]
MIATLIIGGEIAFWILVVAGLCSRYILGWRKLGASLLLITPIVDLLLIIFTIIDLRSGVRAEFIHGLAAIYIGVTVAYGHRMIKWADERFAYRFANGNKPKPSPKYGEPHAKHERQGWYRHVLAWFIGIILLGLMILIVGDPLRTQKLKDVAIWWGGYCCN